MGIWSIIEKEFYHIIRDYRTLIILFMLPVIQMIMFGYALNMEIQEIPIKIVDLDHSGMSYSLIRSFQGSHYYKIVPNDESSIIEFFQKGKIRAYVTIPDDFAKDFLRGKGPQIDITLDASNASEAISMNQYIRSTILQFIQKNSGGISLPVSLSPRFQYNPELNSSFFFVPGLVALILIMISALLTSLTIAREKEFGTFTLLRISPLHSYEIIIGKVIPYLVLSFLIGILIISLGVFLFKVPVIGSIPSLLFYIFIYSLTGISFGIMISTIASSQQVAMLIAMTTTLLPTLIISGFIFPLESMPRLLQILSTIVPAKYFLIIIRGIMLKGNTQRELLPQIIILLGFSILFLIIATKKFKNYLEK